MKIWVNQEEQEHDSPLTLSGLLTKLQKINKTGIAVALNNAVIPKNQWDTTSLSENDKVTIITATQGG